MKFSTIGTAIASVAIALAPQAGASTQDDDFLAMLAQAGIPAHDGIPSVISTGHEVCDALDRGESPSEIADTLANLAYSESPSSPLDRYQRSMARFVQVSAQAFCPGRASGAAWREVYRVVLTGQEAPDPPPVLPDGPDLAHIAPPVAAAKPKQTPPPEQKPPPPANVAPPPSQGSHGDQGDGGTGNGAGGDDGGGGAEPAPQSPGGHIVLLP